MSVHYIYMKDGAKMMRPVLTREEYMALRDNEQNRRADKKHMVQMNYSCLPNEDGSLKGAKRMSSTIGADIDVPISTEFVLSKKEELGLLMFENSATKEGCGHVVCRRLPELSQEENLKRISEILGVEYDKGAKDITRVFYTPADKLVFLDDEIFTIETSNYRSIEGEENRTKSLCVNEGVTALQCYSSEMKYRGVLFADIVAKYWELFNDGKEPVEGDRNVKTYELAMTLRPICDYQVETMMKVIPRYDGFPEEEYVKTLENAAKEPRKGMPYRLRQVLQALKSESAVKATGGTVSVPPPMPERLPPLIRLLTKNVPKFYKPAVAAGVFPALGTHLHGVKFRYWDNVDHEATFMNVLIARQSIGKGCIKMPIERIIASIKEKDKPNRLREAEWKRNNPSGKTKPKDPRPTDICIQVVIDNLTDAVFNQRVADADVNGERYIYTIVDEIEALKKVTSKGTAEEVSLLIRKAFDNAIHGQERVGADSVSGIAPLRWVWNASTTPPNARRFFYQAVNDGTLGRLDCSTITLKEEEEDPVYGIYDEAFDKELKPYLDRLDAASGLIECPKSTKLALAMKKENDDTAKLYESEAYKVFSYRANVIAWLKGMVLYIAHGYRWSKEIADFVRWSEAYNLWVKMLYFGQQLEDELREEMNMQKAAGPQNLLDLLDTEFTKEQYQQMRVSQGKSGDGESTLRVWKSRGYIEWDDVMECYHKTETYLRRS